VKALVILHSIFSNFDKIMLQMKIILTFVFFLLISDIAMAQGTVNKDLDWQGHRGARGLAPENSIPAFLAALSYPSITTLELDVVISADGKVVVSHEPWLNADICLDAKGKEIPKNTKMNLYKMDYSEIKKCDCGSKGNKAFLEQKAVFTYKPLLKEVVKAVDDYCKLSDRKFPRFNIEIKSKPEADALFTPEVSVFVEIVRKEIKKLKLADRSCIQSFDPRALRYLHEKEKNWTLAYLVEKIDDVNLQIKNLGFKPAIYSPHFEKLNQATVILCHEMGMKIIPWTVNDTLQMQKLVQLGVDGIITDYPNRIPEN
jgi:glycerophosphoryl diester phosphodiesterase